MTLAAVYTASAKKDMAARGWKLEHEPYRRFTNGEHTQIPNEDLEDDEAWLLLWLVTLRDELNDTRTRRA